PAPQMGSVSMIKYLEKLEEHQTTLGATVTVLVEEHFQMNFATGEWKTVRSIRQADPNHAIGGQDQGNQTRIVVLDPSQQHHFITTSCGRAQQPIIAQSPGGGGGVGVVGMPGQLPPGMATQQAGTGAQGLLPG